MRATSIFIILSITVGQAFRRITTTDDRMLATTLRALSRSMIRRRGELSLAPMMEYTDCHFRFFMRLITKKMVMWTEMVSATSVVCSENKLDRFLWYNEKVDNPVVLQLGGSDPDTIYAACQLALPYKYNEINLNVGCPSDRVAGKGSFGAALMREPKLVSRICQKMDSGSNGLPISVKCRIGVDDEDSYNFLKKFVNEVSGNSNVTHFVVHARKAILKGLNPEQNRNIPPLNYDYVYQLVSDFPHLKFTINGGVRTYEDVMVALMNGVHGVMVGRAILDKPWYWSLSDSKVFGCVDSNISRRQLLELYSNYAEGVERKTGEKRLQTRRKLVKPLWNLFHGEVGGKRFRKTLGDCLVQDICFGAVVEQAASNIHSDVLDALPGDGKTFSSL